MKIFRSFFSIQILLLLFLNSFMVSPQNIDPNLDFEQLDGQNKISHWKISGNTKINRDSTYFRSGSFSVKIKIQKVAGLHNVIEKHFQGDSISFSGYIKTKNTSHTFPGLIVRTKYGTLAAVKGKTIKASQEWTRFEIHAPFSKKVSNIVLVIQSEGNGELWLDDFSIKIDGVDIQKLKPFIPKVPLAQKDHEFDKGSGISIIPTDKKTIQDLKELCFIWGFLKYYHPNIAKGKYNWDYELFRILPKVLNTKNDKERDELFTEWIKSLGTLTPPEEPMKDTLKTKQKPDLDWIQNSGYSHDLTDLLLEVKNADKPKINYYVTIYGSAPIFKNENNYASRAYPDAGFRLLALFRFWNAIQYYYPYRYLMEENEWTNTLEKFIPKIINTKNKVDYARTMLELICHLKDSHAHIFANDYSVFKEIFGFRETAVDLSFIEDKIVVRGFSDPKLVKETNLKIGDIIKKINHKPIEQIIEKELKYISGSNQPNRLEALASRILRRDDTLIHLEYVRNGKTKETTLKTYPNVISKNLRGIDTSFTYLDKNIGYINIGVLKNEEMDEIWKKVKGTKGLIIDARNYPPIMPYTFFNRLLPKRTPYAKFSIASIKTPGRFTFLNPQFLGNKNENYYKGTIVVLVNEYTQSAGETTVMVFRAHPNTVVIGSATSGANGNTTHIKLPGGLVARFTGMGAYYPDGREVQRVGVIPDIMVKPTIEGIKQGRDELLEKAIQVINQKK